MSVWTNRTLALIPWLRLWLIHLSDERQLRILKEKFDPQIEAAKQAKDAKQENKLISEYLDLRDRILHPTYGLIAENLEKKARKLGIRVPEKPHGEVPGDVEEDANWEMSYSTWDWMLTPGGERKLRNEIRAEQRAGNEEKRKWATLIFAVLGTAFAFWSLIKKEKQPDPCPRNYYRNDAGACVFALPAVVPSTLPQPAPQRPKSQTPPAKP